MNPSSGTSSTTVDCPMIRCEQVAAKPMFCTIGDVRYKMCVSEIQLSDIELAEVAEKVAAFANALIAGTIEETIKGAAKITISFANNTFDKLTYQHTGQAERSIGRGDLSSFRNYTSMIARTLKAMCQCLFSLDVPLAIDSDDDDESVVSDNGTEAGHDIDNPTEDVPSQGQISLEAQEEDNITMG